ncbi:MAG: NTP transferase domain-containing protein [Muribaculaceae bacterium]|nr:NTP transferase domain-containing protein [Muribaculaceae bacterium]
MNFAIIAAGEGSRLAQEGVMLPKPLVDIDGHPMIGRLLDIFARCGADRIVVCVNEFMTEVRDFLENYTFTSVKSSDIPELILKVKTTPSSMHTMAEIADSMQGHGRWIATTVDTIFHEEDFIRYVRAWEKAPAVTDVMMAVTDFVDDEKPLWVITDPDDMRIEGFVDERPENARYISGGIYGLSDSAIGVLRRCMQEGVSRMRNYQRRLVSGGLDVRAFPMGKIIDVDHAADIAVANRFLREK